MFHPYFVRIGSIQKVFLNVVWHGLVLSMVGCSLSNSLDSETLISGEVSTPKDQNSLSQGTDQNANQTTDLQVGQKVVIGAIASNPTEQIRQLQPIADYLAQQLNSYQIQTGEVMIASDISTMSKLLKSGSVDLYFGGFYPSLGLVQNSNAQPILRYWKGESAQDHAVIFSHAKTGVSSLEELKGEKIAFADSISTLGFRLPALHLKEAELKLVPRNSIQEAVPAEEVGYLFSKDDQNSVQWVMSRRVNGAAISGENFQQLPASSREQMVVLARTDKLPQAFVLSRPNLDTTLLESVRQVLLQINQAEAGRAALETFDQATTFDVSPSPEDLAKMQETYKNLQEP
ncbi:MAG: phosphate/phosphite/phosphonate ABC transporter substrate-binding protein [Microcoleaceae cyanobacterium]